MGTQIKVSSQGGFVKVLLILLLLLLGTSFWLYSNNKKLKTNNRSLKTENVALSQNVYAFTGEIKKYKIKLDSVSLYVSQVNALTIKVEDWKRLYTKEAELVKKLKIKPPEVAVITQITSSSRDTVFVPIYQNIEKRDSASYISKWIDITYQKFPNQQGQFTYEKRDCTTLVQYYERKQFLFIKYKKKSDKLQVLSHDPKTTILGVTYKKIIK